MVRVTPLLFALLQDAEPPTEPLPPPPPPVVEPAPAPPPPLPPVVERTPPPPREPPPEIQAEPEPMSEGRMLVHLRESGFQWGLSPGVVFVNGEAGFALGLYLGYGIDTGPVIVVPGLRLSGYFTDPSVYVGMPDVKIAFPIDRFEPFLEGGVGVGLVTTDPSKTGVALMGGGGFMIHFRPVAFGAAVTYQTITGTGFEGIGVGPILAIGL